MTNTQQKERVDYSECTLMCDLGLSHWHKKEVTLSQTSLIKSDKTFQWQNTP